MSTSKKEGICRYIQHVSMLVDAVESLFQFHKRPKGERPQREEARGGQL